MFEVDRAVAALRAGRGRGTIRPPTSRWRGREPTSTVLVGRDDGALVASVLVGHDGHRGWVYYVAVDPDRRSKGFWPRDHGRAPRTGCARAASQSCN